MPTSVTRYFSNNRVPRRGRVSAGLLMFRRGVGGLEVFLARPGGPWFPNRDHDIWTIPKGEVEPGEDLMEAAVREFREEVGIDPLGPFLELGSVRQRGGKTVHAWGFEGDWDDSVPIRTTQVEVEWPAGSGQWSLWPEIDRATFFPVSGARDHMKVAQQPFLDRLAEAVRQPARFAIAPN
jgi:predicted NUDIX family NTP pyrophosphohydrolase